MKQYQESALRTLSDQYHIGAINPDLLHGAIGLVTEAGELVEAMHIGNTRIKDKVNLVEEMGDLMWYVAVVCHALHTTIDAVRPPLTPGYIDEMLADPRGLAGVAILISTHAAHTQDILKRTIYYGAPLNTTGLTDHIKCIISLIEVGCRHLDTNIEAACAINIAKLQRRFPNRFASAHAIERDLHSERAALEAGVGNG